MTYNLLDSDLPKLVLNQAHNSC